MISRNANSILSNHYIGIYLPKIILKSSLLSRITPTIDSTLHVIMIP